MDTLWIIFLILFSIVGLTPTVLFIYSCYKSDIKKQQIRSYIHELANNGLELTTEQFCEIAKSGGGYLMNYPGVYILYNKTKNMHYVGQSFELYRRINAHFTGKGNGDVYADYKYGDEFTIKIIKFEESGYTTLNQLEAATIFAYNAYGKGYNKTRGNR